jgi:DNA polymerase-3 subunit alpha
VRTIICKNGKSAGQKMAIVTFEDGTGGAGGSVETVMFAECYANFGHLIEADRVLFVLGRVDRSRAGMVTGRGPAGGAKGGGAGGAVGMGDDEHGGAMPPQENNNSGVQVIVDRVVPIDGVPLMPGRLWLRVDSERLNGTGESALRAASDLMHQAMGEAVAGVDGGGGGGGGSNERTTLFPIDLVVDTAAARVRLETDPRLRVAPTPDLVKGLLSVLGPGSIKVVGGISADKAEKPRWSGGKKDYAKRSAG